MKLEDSQSKQPETTQVDPADAVKLANAKMFEAYASGAGAGCPEEECLKLAHQAYAAEAAKWGLPPKFSINGFPNITLGNDEGTAAASHLELAGSNGCQHEVKSLHPGSTFLPPVKSGGDGELGSDAGMSRDNFTPCDNEEEAENGSSGREGRCGETSPTERVKGESVFPCQQPADGQKHFCRGSGVAGPEMGGAKAIAANADDPLNEAEAAAALQQTAGRSNDDGEDGVGKTVIAFTPDEGGGPGEDGLDDNGLSDGGLSDGGLDDDGLDDGGLDDGGLDDGGLGDGGLDDGGLDDGGLDDGGFGDGGPDDGALGDGGSSEPSGSKLGDGEPGGDEPGREDGGGGESRGPSGEAVTKAKRERGRPASGKVSMTTTVSPEAKDFADTLPPGLRGDMVNAGILIMKNGKIPEIKDWHRELRILQQQLIEMLNGETPFDSPTRFNLISLAGQVRKSLESEL